MPADDPMLMLGRTRSSPMGFMGAYGGGSPAGPVLSDERSTALKAATESTVAPSAGGMDPWMKAYIATQGVGALAEMLGGYMQGRRRGKAFRSIGG
jgi:hypothetical protein